MVILLFTGSSSTPLRAWDSWEEEEYFFFMKGMKFRGYLIDLGLLYGNSLWYGGYLSWLARGYPWE